MTVEPICLKCKHFNPDLNGDSEGIFFCEAFPKPESWTKKELRMRENRGILIDPKGIPDEIIFGENDHSKLIKGQEGDFIFEASDDVFN